jgi:ribosomal 50S subunit-recycling heat shock protein
MVTEKRELQVKMGLGHVRLDDYLFARFGGLSRMYLRELVKTNQVLVNGEYSNVGIKLRANDFIEITEDEASQLMEQLRARWTGTSRA